MKALFLIILSVLMALSAGYAYEMDKPETRGSHRERFGMEHRLEMLDLSTEQMKKIEDIKIKTQKAIIPAKADIELKHIDLENEMKADKPNRGKVMKILRDITDLEFKIKQARMDQKLQIKSILTPEQREKLRAPMHKRMKEHMKMQMMEKPGGEQMKVKIIKEPCEGCKEKMHLGPGEKHQEE